MKNSQLDYRDINRTKKIIQNKSDHFITFDNKNYISSSDQKIQVDGQNELKDEIVGLQKWLKNINEKVKMKKQSLTILKKQSAIQDKFKQNDQLNLLKDYEGLNHKKYNRKQSQDYLQFLQPINKNKQLLNQPDEIKTYYQEQRQRYFKKRMQNDPSSCQNISTVDNLPRSSILTIDFKGQSQSISTQTKVDNNIQINSESQSQNYLTNNNFKGVFLKRKMNQKQNTVENLKINKNVVQMPEYYSCSQISDIIQEDILKNQYSSVRLSKQNKCKSNSSLFDNQVILNLIKDAQKQVKDRTKEQLKETVQICNQKILQAINQNSTNHLNSNIIQQSNLSSIKTEGGDLKKCSLYEQVGLILKKKQQDKQDINQNQIQDKQKNSPNQSQKYFYAPKLTQKYNQNSNSFKREGKHQIIQKENNYDDFLTY